MNGWSLVIIYCETGSSYLIQNLNLSLQVSKNNAHSTTLSCFPTAPLSLHLKGLLSFSLLFLYESFIVLAKIEYCCSADVSHSSSSSRIYSLFSAAGKLSLLSHLDQNLPYPLRSSWNAISFLKTKSHVLKGCWTALASVAQLAGASSHIPKGWWIQFSVRVHIQAAGSIPRSGCMWEVWGVTNPCFSFTAIFCPLSKINQSINKRLLDWTPPVSSHGCPDRFNISGYIIIFVKLACAYNLIGLNLYMPLQRNNSIWH